VGSVTEGGVQDVSRLADTGRGRLVQRESRGRPRSVATALYNEVSDAGRTATPVPVERKQGPKKPAGHAYGQFDHLLMAMEVQRLQPVAPVVDIEMSTPIATQDQVAAKTPLYRSADDVGVRHGDHWPVPNVKLRWSALASIGDVPVALQTYGFVDTGRLWRRGRLLSGKRRSATVAAVGLRLRLNMTGQIEASRIVKAPSGGQHEQGGRLLRNVSFRF
jgi:hypothetical protein